ncbi:phosphosulfolactate synthase [Paenibacillaceae bacterium]|nr:phosphosulfolactate synthase [Paenibacillaceae bacterium]
MEATPHGAWHQRLLDPSGVREHLQLPEIQGQTMVIDKGLGKHAFADLLETAAPYIQFIKLGFGTSPLYEEPLLRSKIQQATDAGIIISPGGTLLEMAVYQQETAAFFRSLVTLGFTGVEISDGTIEISRQQRTELIKEGIRHGLCVVTEYGKKTAGTLIDPFDFAKTAEADLEAGAEYVIVEARESGVDIGLFDSVGNCREDLFDQLLRRLPGTSRIMWEAPLKSQQAFLLKSLGSNIHLGNIAPSDVLSLEAMRRGLRSDTFPETEAVVPEPVLYMI